MDVIFSVIGSCSRLNILVRDYHTDILPPTCDHTLHLIAKLTPAA